VGELLAARAQEIGQEAEGLSETITRGAHDFRQQIENTVGDVIRKGGVEVREQVGQGVTALMDDRISNLRRGIEEGVESALAARIAELRKDLQNVVQDVAGKRIANLRREIERVVEDRAESRLQQLRSDVLKTLGDTTDQRIADLRRDSEKMVAKSAENRAAGLRQEVERVVADVAGKRTADIGADLERVAAEAGEQRITELRKEVVSRVAQEIGKAFSGKSPETPASTLLDSAVVSIQESTSQTDILRSLLDGAAYFAPRVALFVVRGEVATGWQARGLQDGGVVRTVSIDVTSGLAARAMQQGAVYAAASDFDPAFIRNAGAPADGSCLLLPLLVRDRVPALIYADAGAGVGQLDPAALQLLVRTAGLWLEVVTLRKLTGDAAPAETVEQVEVAAVGAAVSPATQTRSRMAPVQQPATKPLNAEEEEIHKKARRFAKLLVDEIKLYNQAKVAEGRQHHDLYDRLKEDIEKSRASYDKRYGNTAAASGDYFNQEVVRILAENDASVLGSNFPQ
jgi:hypothetical protein